MTVISTLINRHCTVHASDSFITDLQDDGTRNIHEAKRTKIVRVEPFRGAMAYWGLASVPSQWSTLDWLQEQVGNASEFSSPEDFASYMADELDKRLSHLKFERELDRGIGIHFTAYEYIGGYWIPELFVLSNFFDPTYQALHDGIKVNRQTFNAACCGEPKPEHRESEYRITVYKYLQDGSMLTYNNGDPVMFNVAATALFNQINVARSENLAALDEVATYRRIARIPIRMVSKVQRDLYRPGKRIVGGKIHSLSITPGGEYVYESEPGG